MKIPHQSITYEDQALLSSSQNEDNLCDENQLKERHCIDIKLTLLLFRSSKDEADHKFKLVTHIHRPYSYIVPCGRFLKKVYL